MPAKGPSKKTKLVTQSKRRIKKTSQRKIKKRLSKSVTTIDKPHLRKPVRLAKGNRLKFKRPKAKMRKRKRMNLKRAAAPLILTSKNDKFRHRRGVSIARPEILFQMNFIPGYTSDGVTKHKAIHTVLDAQKSLRSLYVENNGEILERLNQNEALEDEIEKILEEYDQVIVGVKETIRQLGAISDYVKSTKHYLDFKARGPGLIQEYNDKQAGRKERSVERLQSSMSALKTKAEAARISGGNVAFYTAQIKGRQKRLNSLTAESLDEIHEVLTDTGFKKTSFNNFSNTKVVGQILFDLKATLTNHSPCLIDKNKGPRARDQHPFNIDSSIRSKSSDTTGFSLEEYTGLSSVKEVHKTAIADLPKDDADRSRVLINELMKISRMSISLKSAKVNNFIEENFPGAPRNNSMWDEVYGQPEGAIKGASEMFGASSILRLAGGDGNPILPLENAYIRSRNGQIIYEPGSIVLCDHILDSGEADATRYAGYARHYMMTMTRTTKITTMMNYVGRTARGASKRTSNGRTSGQRALGSRHFDFHGDSFFRQITKTVLQAHDGLGQFGKQGGNAVESWDQNGLALLFDSADEDDEFRFMLIRFLLLILRKKELSENEALIEYLSQDEELSKQLEQEQLLARLTAPEGADSTVFQNVTGGRSSTQKALTSPLSEFATASECSQVLQKLKRVMSRQLKKKFKKPKRTSVSRQRSRSHASRRSSNVTKSPPKSAEMGPITGVMITQLLEVLDNPESGVYWYLNRLVIQYDKFLLGAKKRVSPQGVRDATSMGSEMDDEVKAGVAGVRSAGLHLQVAGEVRNHYNQMANASQRKADQMDAIAMMPYNKLMDSMGDSKWQQSIKGTLQDRADESMFGRLGDMHEENANRFREAGNTQYDAAAAQVASAEGNLDFLERARRALKRNAMDAVPDIFEIDEDNPTRRLSRYGQIPEENFKYLWMDSVFTIIGETYDIHVSKVYNLTSPATVLVSMQINQSHHNATMNAIRDMQGKKTLPSNYATIVEDAEAEYYQQQSDFFNGTENALEEERIFISKRVRVLNMFGTSIVKKAIRVSAYFDLSIRSHKPWKQALNNVMHMPGGNTILAGLNDEQMRLKHSMVESLSTNTKEQKRIPVAHYDKFKAGQAVFLSEFLKERKFRSSKADNLNILAVGLPIGMIKDLQTGIIDNIARLSAFDPYKRNALLRLKVWKRDQQFDDLVFRPQQFTFDHTIFLSPVDSFADVKVGDKFKDIAKSKLKYIDYDEEGRLDAEGQEYSELRASDDLRLIKSKSRYAVIRNSLYSEGLKYYIRLLTGINLDEQEYFLDKKMSAARQKIGKNKATRKIISSIVAIYLSQEGIETEAQYLANKAMIDQITSFTQTTIFKAQANALTAIHPTVFDRIFCLGVDPDDFEIDKRKTMSTRSGRKALRSALRMKKVRRYRGRYYLKARRKNEGKVAIYEYFVTAEMLLGNRSIYKKRLRAERRELRDNKRQTPWANFMDSDGEESLADQAKDWT